jgi:ABC-type lipoprotein release transport system permease subunit
MTIGNGIISGMDKGLKETIINSFTGDIVIVSEKQESDNVFMEFMGKAVAPIFNYKDIKNILSNQPIIEKFLPAGKNLAMVLNEEEYGMPGNAFLIGIDFEQYSKMFPNNIKVIEGNYPKKGEAGVLITSGARKDFAYLTNIWFLPKQTHIDSSKLPKELKIDYKNLIPKNDMVLMGYNEDNTTTDIRVPISGVIEFKALNSLWGQFVLIDIESYRKCLGYFTMAEKTELSEEEKKFFTLDNKSLDEIFNNELIVNRLNNNLKSNCLHYISLKEKSNTHSENDIESGAYNLILVLLKKNENPNKAVLMLNEIFKKQNLGVRAILWKKALGTIGGITTIIKASLFLFVMFLFFVAIIIIINTLSMTIIERTQEIGMMRAIGARKGLISFMLLTETAILAFVSGGMGIVCGTIVVKLLSFLNITSTNDAIQLLFGGDKFCPVLSVEDIFITILQLFFVTILAVVYPVLIAQKITPLNAIARE